MGAVTTELCCGFCQLIHRIGRVLHSGQKKKRQILKS